MIVIVDDEVPRDNDFKQLDDDNLIATWNVSRFSCILSSLMFILNDDLVDPAYMVTLLVFDV